MDAPVNGPNPDNPLKFVGKLGCYSDKYTTYSDDTGLILMGARYYDPLIGRFITQDPSRDGLNWYMYAGNNPVNSVDPSGMIALRRSPSRPARLNPGGMFNKPDYYGQQLMNAWERGDKSVGDSTWQNYLWSNEQVSLTVQKRIENKGENGPIGKPMPVKLNTTVGLGTADSRTGYDLLGVVALQMTGTVTNLGYGVYIADLDISVTDTLDLHPFTYGTDFIRAIGAGLRGIPPWRKIDFESKWHGTYIKSGNNPYYRNYDAEMGAKR